VLHLADIKRLGPCAFMLILGALSPGLRAQDAQTLKVKALPSGSASITESSSARSTKSRKVTTAGKPVDAAVEPMLQEVYRLGVEDEIQISVWREPDLSLSSVVVRPDGMITVPLVNDIPVVGLTPQQLQNTLMEKLKVFVNDPQVTVIVRSIRSRRVYLMGEVGRPGAYSLNGRKTVLQLLAEAGGMGPFAKRDSTYILRHVNGRRQKIEVRYRNALAGRTSDPELMPGDIVVVP
jgi:polysaccharide export outer membrane protein